jgi:hypothetical protein
MAHRWLTFTYCLAIARIRPQRHHQSPRHCTKCHQFRIKSHTCTAEQRCTSWEQCPTLYLPGHPEEKRRQLEAKKHHHQKDSDPASSNAVPQTDDDKPATPVTAKSPPSPTTATSTTSTTTTQTLPEPPKERKRKRRDDAISQQLPDYNEWYQAELDKLAAQDPIKYRKDDPIGAQNAKPIIVAKWIALTMAIKEQKRMRKEQRLLERAAKIPANATTTTLISGVPVASFSLATSSSVPVSSTGTFTTTTSQSPSPSSSPSPSPSSPSPSSSASVIVTHSSTNEQ